jgi:hypothetical protein
VVEVPAGATSGPFVVEVTDGGSATSAQTFTVFSALGVESMTPNNGPPGTLVTLRGTGFSPTPAQNVVTVNGGAARVVSATDVELVFEVPRGATSGPVEVVTRANRRRVRDPFRITNPPQVLRFAPTSGSPGTEVTIYGNNFGDSTHGFHVRLGTVECPILAVGPTQARVRIPDGAATNNVEVEVHAQGSSRSATTLTVYAAVAVREFLPARGPTGTEVTIRGAGFSPTLRDNTVLVGGRPAPVVAAGDTELRITVPPRIAGGRLRVSVRGRGTVETTDEFVVTRAPVVRSFSPAAGPPGTEVTLVGDNFAAALDQVTVTLAGVPCELTAVGPTRVSLRVPQRASTARFQVTVAGMGSGDSATDFTVEVPLSVAGFAPSGGPVGTEVTLSGAGFSARTRDNQVFIGTEPAAVLRSSAEEVVVRIPANATTGRFRVVTVGMGEAESRVAFRVEVALEIASLEPSAGQPGVEVRVLGRGLAQAGLEVLIGSIRVPHTVVSDTELRATIPAGARSGPFIVRVPRIGEARSRTAFTVTDPPVLTAMSPTVGPPGTVVTVEGRNFDPMIPRNVARIDQIRLLIESVSPTQMRVRIPPNAQTGPITVEVEGRGQATTPRPFRVTQPAQPAAPPPPPSPPAGVAPPPAGPTAPLVVQGFSPRTGPVGTLVQLLGDGWGARAEDLQVWVGAAPAPIVSVDGRMLTIRVPDNAQTGTIRIMRRGPDGGASAQTPVPFTVR